MKKPYEKPRIIHTETLELRAISCLRTSDAQGACGGTVVA